MFAATTGERKLILEHLWSVSSSCPGRGPDIDWILGNLPYVLGSWSHLLIVNELLNKIRKLEVSLVRKLEPM